MPAPLGVRTCPALGCSRRVHVTTGGTVWARCVAHALELLNFAAPRRATESAVPPVAGSDVLPVAAEMRR